MEIKSKEDLDKVSYSVRAAQAVLQYGVGAMVDFPDQTLVTAAPETWTGRRPFYDERFSKSLGVEYFVMPEKISYSRFPEWYFCPKCREFKPIEKWIKQWKEAAVKNSKLRKIIDKDQYIIKHMQCPKCHQDLVVSRIVTVCSKGHLNDFPWTEWVHEKAKKKCTQSNAVLKFKTGASGTEGLEGLSIVCSCGAKATLSGAFDKEVFAKMDEKNGTNLFRCKGHHPFKNTIAKCIEYPRTVQRGASSVYFPLVYSSLVIPPFAEKLNSLIEDSFNFSKYISILEEEEPEDRKKKAQEKLNKWAKTIALEIGKPSDAVEKILRRKFLDETEQIDVGSIQYKMQEYDALTGEIALPNGDFGDFSREEMDVGKYHLAHLKSVTLIDKVKVVNALVGFSRVNPITSMDDEGFVSVKENNTTFYPAYEVRGEGIFIELDNGDINQWIDENLEVKERAKKLTENFRESYIGKNSKRVITPKFLMLHTLSHLLIDQLSFECGYNVASLSERIYCSEKNDGKEMSGIFIYTASGDAEGTLGGLVRQGYPDALPNIFTKAIEKARTCSNDPICILSHGQGRDSLNLAACHSCALLPETCCEEKNVFLDRAMIVGTFTDPTIGFYS